MAEPSWFAARLVSVGEKRKCCWYFVPHDPGLSGQRRMFRLGCHASLLVSSSSKLWRQSDKHNAESSATPSRIYIASNTHRRPPSNRKQTRHTQRTMGTGRRRGDDDNAASVAGGVLAMFKFPSVWRELAGSSESGRW